MQNVVCKDFSQLCTSEGSYKIKSKKENSFIEQTNMPNSFSALKHSFYPNLINVLPWGNTALQKKVQGN